MSKETEIWTPFNSFKSIAASVVKACIRFSEAQLTGGMLIEVSMLARITRTCSTPECNDLQNRLTAIKEENLYSFRRELTRNKLVTVIGILDFCLYEVLVFMINVRPSLLDNPQWLEGLPKRKAGEEILTYTKRFLTRTGIERRLDLARDMLGIVIPQDLRDELGLLIAKRNEIAHHSKYYEAIPFESTFMIEARAFPEVSFDEAMTASITAIEICDSVLVTVARDFFEGDLGDLRPLNPSLAEYHQEMRRQIQEKRNSEPTVENITDAGWEVIEFGDSFVNVMDRTKTLSIAATGIESFPVLLGCLKSTAHGKKSYFKIDHNEKEEDGIKKPPFLPQLLEGRSMLVEYSDEASDSPLLIRFSLAGFAEAWSEATELKRAKSEPKR